MAGHDDGLNRVFLWGMTRSMSTAVTKSLSCVDGIQVVNQPSSIAHYRGPDAVLPDRALQGEMRDRALVVYDEVDKEIAASGALGIDDGQLSYRFIRDELLAAPYPDKTALLCRDQAWYLDGRYDMLPQGFKYSFLIRHPVKVLVSFKKLLLSNWGEFRDMRALPPLMFPPGCGFKELHDLVEHVRDNIDPHPTIMDADDLLTDPAGILTAYCRRMGLPYSERLLTWRAGSAATDSWIMGKSSRAADTVYGFYASANQSEGFHAPRPVPDLDGLDQDIQACVKFSMPYYEKMYRERITTNSKA